MKQLSLFVVLVCLQVPGFLCTCTTTLQTSERSSQAVELKFYRIQTSEWNEREHSAKVAVQVATFAITYCSSNPALCGMETCCSGNTTFKSTNVGIVTGYPEDDRNDLRLKIYLDLPSGANATGTLQCVVEKGALQAIVGSARDAIHTETGSWITYIDDIFYGIPPASDLNRILIPVAFVILFLICLTAIILHFWNKRQEELERKKKIIEKRKASQKKKAEPKYNVDTSEPKALQGVTGKNAAHAKPKRAQLHYKATFGAKSKPKDELYREHLRQSEMSGKKTTSMTSADSAIHVDTELRQRPTHALVKKLEGEPVKVQGATNFGFDGSAESLPKKELILEPVKPPAHLTPLNVDADTEDFGMTEKEKKKKKKKKHKSKTAEVTQVSDIANDEPYAKTSVWDFSLPT